jgi:hypothetical protein
LLAHERPEHDMIYILCPACHTVARATAPLLNAGEVRCDRCGRVYGVLGQLFDDALEAQAAALARARAPLPEAPDTAEIVVPAAVVSGSSLAHAAVYPSPAAGLEAAAPAVAESLATPVVETVPTPPADVTGADWDAFGHPPLEGDVAATVASSAELDAEVRRQLEETLRAELAAPLRRRVSGRTWLGLAVATLLVLALAGQWLYGQRDQWLDDPRWRPWADRACVILGCELPLRRDIRQLELLEREVRDDLRATEAVIITATFINRADFVQPYPVFEVGFSDLSGKRLAVHRFAPEEYLEDPAVIPTGLAPGQPVGIRLEVPDPGRQAVSFRMEFL